MCKLKKCAIIGGGVMGRQIALNTAIYNYQVVICETSQAVRENLLAWEETYLAGRITKGRMTQEQVDGIKNRLAVTDDLGEACRDADIVIEAVVEIKNVKMDVLGKASRLAPPTAVIATNSSFMVSSVFKDAVADPKRLANLHYFMPALVMKLVEVVRGDHTSQETVDKLVAFGLATGKTPVVLQKETDGFIVNRVLRAIKEEGYRLVEEGVCRPQDVDTAVELGLNHPMGPFKLDDMSGIDVRYDVYQRRLKETGVKSPGYDMLEKLYKEGRYGKKVKKGFYDYD